jgi:phosphatidylethanolamine/phosphatidyl-N-methylethanolamine N-methyltransferase
MAAAAEFYGRWAPLYDRIARHFPGVARVRRRAAAALELSSGDRVVELGCGTGANLPYLREAVGSSGEVVGVDVARPALARARKLAEHRGWDNVHLVAADATRPPVDRADGILESFVAGMLDEPAAVVGEWCDLAAGGTVVLVDAAPSREPYGPLLNGPLRAFTTVSTPPTTKLRYERDLLASLDDRVTAAHDALRGRATAVAHEEHLLGLVRLTGGRLPGSG